MKILLVMLKNLNTLACLNLSYGTSRQIEKNDVKGTKMVGFTKTWDQHPYKFNFGHFFSSIIVSSPPPAESFNFQKST